MENENRSNRFVYDEDNMPKLITNEKIQCKDCVYCYEDTVIECEKYIRKPDYVLDEEQKCSKFCRK